PPRAFTILFVGSGFARKGLATAIEAFAALGDRASRFVVLGKGDARSYRSAAARLGVDERIAWLGARADPERWYAAADIVVPPSPSPMPRRSGPSLESMAAARAQRAILLEESALEAYTADVAPRPAVFMDRDGTLTEEVGYVNHPRRLRILPRSAEAIRRLNE